MVVAVATIVLLVPEPASLKDKRSIVKRVTARVRARFNVAVAEVGTLDEHNTITMGIAALSTDPAHAHGLLEKVLGFIEDERLDAEVAHYGIELY
jgi:uncharacterized protein YlxP (DUF503 family)